MTPRPDDLESRLRQEAKEHRPDAPHGLERRIAQAVSESERPAPPGARTPWALMFAAGTAAALATVALTHVERAPSPLPPTGASPALPSGTWPALASENPLEQESSALQGEAQQAAQYLRDAFVPGSADSGRSG